MADGTKIAFCDLTDEARRYPVTMHRAALKTMALARELRIRRLVATTESGHPAAERWLLRLGFEPREICGKKVFIRDKW